MAGFTGASPIITDGLVFAVDAANYESYPGSGTTWTDLAGSNNGTLTNGPTFDSGNGGSIVFDGADDYISAGTAANFVPTGNMTLSAWINIDNYDSCIYMVPDSTGGNEMIFWVAPSSNGSFYVGKRLASTFNNSVGSSGNWAQNNTNIPLNTWTNVVLVRNGGDVSYYVNGSSDGGGTRPSNTLSYASGQPLYIGTDTDGGSFTRGNFFDGKMASGKIYNRILTTTEILQNYNALKSRFNL